MMMEKEEKFPPWISKSPHFFKRKIQENEDNLRFSQVAEFEEKGEKKKMSWPVMDTNGTFPPGRGYMSQNKAKY